MEETRLELELPGFRFHPTEEELLDFYLKKMVSGKNTCSEIIGFLNIYKHDPWNLPGLSKIGEREWYFFVPRNRKHGRVGRPNRTTENGFWKATGSDRKIFALSDTNKHLGLKKTLVFYKGRAPRGDRTDWVMSEYRLPDSCSLSKEIVLCKIYRKATSMKELEIRAAKEDAHLPPSMGSSHVASHNNDLDEETEENDAARKPSLKLPIGAMLSEVRLPRSNMDWSQDLQSRSPWLHNLIFTPPPYANKLNFFD